MGPDLRLSTHFHPIRQIKVLTSRFTYLLRRRWAMAFRLDAEALKSGLILFR